MFLGINSVDCLLCHDGARHLDAVNLWGKQQKRADIWGLSAFFARTQMKREVVNADPLYARFIVSEMTAGEYALNTRIGNRTSREPVGDIKQAAPRYPFTGETISFGPASAPGAGGDHQVTLLNTAKNVIFILLTGAPSLHPDLAGRLGQPPEHLHS